MTTKRQQHFRAVVLAATLLVSASFSAASDNQAPASPVKPEAPVTALPAAPAAAPTSSTAAVPLSRVVGRIGYVDIMRIADESEIGKTLKARFKERSNKVQSQLSSKQKQLEKQKSSLETKLPSMIPDQRTAKIKEYEKKVEEFRAAVKNAEKEMQPLQDELTQTITRETVAACEAFGKKNGFAAISVSKNLPYVSPDFETTDVTSEIINAMNEKK